MPAKATREPLWVVGKPPHIADLRHELWSGDLACALHFHDHIEFRQQGGQTEHLPAQDIQRVIDGVQAVYGLSDEQLGAVVFGKCSHGVSGSGVEPFSVRLREAIAGSGAPFAVSIRENGEGNACHAVLVPEAFHKIHPFEMPIRPLGLDVKKCVDAGEGLIQQGDQTVAEDHAGFLGAQVQAVLHFQHLPCFVLRRVIPQLRPEGQGIVGDFHGIRLVCLDLAQRVVAEIVDEHGVDHADEKASLFQGQGDGPPVHPRVFHDNADVPADAPQRPDQTGQSGGVMFHLERRQYHFAARSANSNSAFPFGNINADGGDWFIVHLQTSQIKNGFNRHPPLPTTDSACFVTRVCGVVRFSTCANRTPQWEGRLTVCANERDSSGSASSVRFPPIVA